MLCPDVGSSVWYLFSVRWYPEVIWHGSHAWGPWKRLVDRPRLHLCICSASTQFPFSLTPVLSTSVFAGLFLDDHHSAGVVCPSLKNPFHSFFLSSLIHSLPPFPYVWMKTARLFRRKSHSGEKDGVFGDLPFVFRGASSKFDRITAVSNASKSTEWV